MSAPARRGAWERDALVRELAERRQRGELARVVLANGCFDLLHVGHTRYLADARSRGDCLVVALNTDASVCALKGPGRPLVPLAERAELVAALFCVDYVVAFEEDSLERTLRCLRPDVHAKGSDYTVESVPEREVDRELGIEIAICGDVKRRSSSQLLARIGAGASAAPADAAHVLRDDARRAQQGEAVGDAARVRDVRGEPRPRPLT